MAVAAECWRTVSLLHACRGISPNIHFLLRRAPEANFRADRLFQKGAPTCISVAETSCSPLLWQAHCPWQKCARHTELPRQRRSTGTRPPRWPGCIGSIGAQAAWGPAGILIFPKIVKAGFIFGGQGGKGAL